MTSASGPEDGPRQRHFGGMLPDQGVEAFTRALSSGLGPEVIVSTRDIDTLLEQGDALDFSQTQEEITRAEAGTASHPRPEMAASYVALRNKIEKCLAEILQEMLGIEKVGIHDNFFDLGGDSVIATTCLAKANDAGIPLTPAQMFEHQTVADLAAAVALSPAAIVEPCPDSAADDDKFDWSEEDLDQITSALRRSVSDV